MGPRQTHAFRFNQSVETIFKPSFPKMMVCHRFLGGSLAGQAWWAGRGRKCRHPKYLAAHTGQAKAKCTEIFTLADPYAASDRNSGTHQREGLGVDPAWRNSTSSSGRRRMPSSAASFLTAAEMLERRELCTDSSVDAMSNSMQMVS